MFWYTDETHLKVARMEYHTKIDLMQRAIRDGDVDAAVNAMPSLGPVHEYVSYGQTKILESIIHSVRDRHANAEEKSRSIPALKACIDQYFEMYPFEQHNEEGVDDLFFSTGLVCYGNIEALKYLIEKVGLPKADSKNRLLVNAVDEADLDMIIFLVNQNISLNDEVNPAWFVALDLGDRRFLDFLFEKGADINAVNECMENALHAWASFYIENHDDKNLVAKEVLEALVERGIDEKHINIWGQTPVGLSISAGFPGVASLIECAVSKRSADFDAKALDIETPQPSRASSRSSRL